MKKTDLELKFFTFFRTISPPSSSRISVLLELSCFRFSHTRFTIFKGDSAVPVPILAITFHVKLRKVNETEPWGHGLHLHAFHCLVGQSSLEW